MSESAQYAESPHRSDRASRAEQIGNRVCHGNIMTRLETYGLFKSTVVHSIGVPPRDRPTPAQHAQHQRPLAGAQDWLHIFQPPPTVCLRTLLTAVTPQTTAMRGVHDVIYLANAFVPMYPIVLLDHTCLLIC